MLGVPAPPPAPALPVPALPLMALPAMAFVPLMPALLLGASSAELQWTRSSDDVRRAAVTPRSRMVARA
jgi:hypothetical protein